MKDVLEKLYKGELCPESDYKHILESQKMKWDTILSTESKFYAKLSDEMKIEFEKVIDNKMDTVSLDYTETYIDGFRLGVKIMFEVFVDDL